MLEPKADRVQIAGHTFKTEGYAGFDPQVLESMSAFIHNVVGFRSHSYASAFYNAVT